MSEKLRQCPFCGSKDISVEEVRNPSVWWDSNMRGEYCAMVYCEDCKASIKENIESRAIDKWNTRADDLTVIYYQDNPVACPHCGYVHPHVTAVAKGSPNPFTFRISCPLCGYRGELTKGGTEKKE